MSLELRKQVRAQGVLSLSHYCVYTPNTWKFSERNFSFIVKLENV